MNIDELIDRYCRVWTETDPSKRSDLLESIWGPGATYTDPTIANLVKAELLAHIARVLPTRPGATLRRTTAVDEHHGMLRFGFKVIGSDGAVLRHGTDFVVLDADRARIQQVVGFFGDLTAVAD